MSTPTSFPLNGCDTFMLAMDAAMRRDGSCGNICHLLVTFPPHTDLSSITTKITAHPAFVLTSRLRLVTRFLRTPRWKEDRTAEATITIEDSLRSQEHLESRILSRALDVRSSAPFGCVALPQYERGPSLLFFWHHALCDAHGGESILKLLSSPAETLEHTIIPTAPQSDPLLKTLARAHRTKRHIFKKAKGPLARFTREVSAPPTPRYHKILFSSRETSAIDLVSKNITGGMFPSALYLAATARAASGVCDEHAATKTFFVPVPHDIRRITKQRSPLSNQVSFAFFRIANSSAIPLPDTTNEIIGQLHDTIAGEHQRGMLDFLRFIKPLPLRAFWRVIEQPTQGHPASLYFSDIGASLSALESMHGIRVSYATHYPPIVTPPGFTTVWSRYKDKLEVTVCHDSASVSVDAVTKFEELVRRELMGESA